MQCVVTTVPVKCTIGFTITHAADTYVEKKNCDLCLPAVQCRRVHCTSTRYRSCCAVYSAIALYTGTHSSQFIFFTFVSGACIYSTTTIHPATHANLCDDSRRQHLLKTHKTYITLPLSLAHLGLTRSIELLAEMV